MFEEKSKYAFSYNFIKKTKHGNDEWGGWKAYKETMIFEKAKVKAKRVKAFAAWPYSHVPFKVELWWKWCNLEWEKKDGVSKEKAPFKYGGLKVNQLLRPKCM